MSLDTIPTSNAHEDAETELAAFQAEIQKPKDEEAERGETAHLTGTERIPGVEDPTDLTQEDLAVWKLHEAEELTVPEYQTYKKSIPRDARSRHAFAEFVANKMMTYVFKRMREQEKSE